MALYHVGWRKIGNEPKFIRYETDAEGKRLDPIFVDLPVPPYCFAYKDAALKVFPESVFEPTDLIINERPIVKFVGTAPDVVPLARDAIGMSETFEADVPYGRRVLIDTGESLQMPQSYLHFDLEMDPTGGMPDEKLADRQIISIGTKTNTGEERFFCGANETDMINEFITYATQFPILVGFNSNHFDWPYLLNRCRRLGIRYEWWDLHVHVDLLAVYKYVLLKRQDKFSLEHIAKAEKLKARKRAIDMTRLMEYYNSFLDNADQTLKEYNLDDVRVIHELDQKYQMVSTLYNIAAISHTTVKDLLRMHEKSHKEFNTSIAIDGLILHLSGKRTPRIIWRTKEHRELTPEEEEKRREKYTGAHVMTPVPGVHKNVAIFDVGSMYPTIIQSFNMGPETYVSEEDASQGLAGPIDNRFIRSPIGRGWFRKEPKSVFVEALEYVLRFKSDCKERLTRMQPNTEEYNATKATYEAYKVIANSVYGILGSDFSRYYLVDVAENITLTGQLVLKFLKEILERIPDDFD